jgi:enoyl-CoA hydratase/carnithine racemase
MPGKKGIAGCTAYSRGNCMDFETILLEVEPPDARILLNRPQRLNAINDKMLQEIDVVLDEVEPRDDIRFVLIKGAGRAFSVGQDLTGEGTSEVLPPDPRQPAFLTPLYRMDTKLRFRWQRMFYYTKHLVAQVHGYCLAMALDLAMACRTIIAADDAVFGDPSVRMGFAAGNPLWTWRIGPKKAKDQLLTGRCIDGKEAHEIGLITLAVPGDRMEEEVETAIQTIDQESGGIVGNDGEAPVGTFERVAFELGGLSAAWVFTSGLHALGARQRYGFEPEEFNFWDARDRKGLKGAIAERDAPFEKLFPSPKPKTR